MITVESKKLDDALCQGAQHFQVRWTSLIDEYERLNKFPHPYSLLGHKRTFSLLEKQQYLATCTLEGRLLTRMQTNLEEVIDHVGAAIRQGPVVVLLPEEWEVVKEFYDDAR